MRHVRFGEILKDYLEYYNVSNKEFAYRIGVTPKHLIDIMAGNVELSLPIIEAISTVADIPVSYIVEMEEKSKMESEINKYLEGNNITLSNYLSKFSYKKLVSNNWFKFDFEDDKMSHMIDILKYLRVSSPATIYNLGGDTLFKSKNDKPELLMLWLEKCFRETFNQEVKEYKKENIYKLVDFINEEALNNRFDEEKLIKEFNNNGIYLVIQDDLPGSKIRGAFRVNRTVPSIYITRKHKRIADIYFALLHELAHCKTDFNKAKAMSLVSYMDDSTEEKADLQAYNWMVNDEYYEIIKNNKDYNIELENIYPKSFILYRLAKDKKISYSSKIYQEYNSNIANLK